MPNLSTKCDRLLTCETLLQNSKIASINNLFCRVLSKGYVPKQQLAILKWIYYLHPLKARMILNRVVQKEENAITFTIGLTN